jgi:hypothetical protein
MKKSHELIDLLEVIFCKCTSLFSIELSVGFAHSGLDLGLLSLSFSFFGPSFCPLCWVLCLMEFVRVSSPSMALFSPFFYFPFKGTTLWSVQSFCGQDIQNFCGPRFGI